VCVCVAVADLDSKLESIGQESVRFEHSIKSIKGTKAARAHRMAVARLWSLNQAVRHLPLNDDDGDGDQRALSQDRV